MDTEYHMAGLIKNSNYFILNSQKVVLRCGVHLGGGVDTLCG